MTTDAKTHEEQVAEIKAKDRVCFVLASGKNAGQHRTASIKKVETTGHPQWWIDHNKQAAVTITEEVTDDDQDYTEVVAAYKAADPEGSDNYPWGSYHFHTDCGRA